MATSANLPAGFSITSISGVRCTAVPRTATTVAAGAATAASPDSGSSTTSVQNSPNIQTTPSAKTTAAQTTLSSTSVAETTTTPTSAAAAVMTTSISSSTEETTTSTSSTPPPALVAPTTSTTTPAVLSTSPPPTNTATFQTSTTSIVATTPAQPASSATISPSTTTAPIAQSDTLPSPSSSLVVSTSTHDPALHSSGGSHSDGSAHSSTQGAAAVASSGISGTSQSAGSSSTEAQSKAGPIAGGVVGGLAGLALIGFLIWFFLRRRKQRRRSTLLTPLGTSRGSEFYEIDRQSVGPKKSNEKWRTGAGSRFQKVGYVFSDVKERVAILGSSLKSKVVGPRSDTPNVNLNRGQSQFMDGAIPQHSRTNSAASSNIPGRLPVKDRFGDWLERFKQKAAFGRLGNKAKEPEDPFANARGIAEKQATLNENPDFSQLLNMNDRELHLQAERRRASLARGDSVAFSTLGPDFTSKLDPFTDPINPFADPLAQPKPSASKQHDYVADVRRSRGQSTDMSQQPSGTGLGTGAGWRPPSTTPASRYPSTIAPSRDSYRDTVYSGFTTNTRKGRRSDPFDLERPELWGTPPPMPTQISGGLSTIKLQESILASMGRGSAVPAPLSITRNAARIDSSGTYESKYSSGMSFGDPGPDVGPGSVPGSFTNNGLNDYVKELARTPSNASSLSSKGGVGKAR